MKSIYKKVHIMCDLETLGTGDCPPVFQISAKAFDIEDGEIVDEFDMLADITKMDNIEGKTLAWWLNTNKELLTQLVNDGKTAGNTEKHVIECFVLWINRLQRYVSDKTHIFLWGNGVLFDNRIIKAKCDQYGIEYPIFYRNDMDMRTVMEVAAMKRGLPGQCEYRNLLEKTGTAHNATDDVINQINILVMAVKELAYGIQ